ncbi:site-2 protease family protein [Clostridium sp.]|uniref:site-2 protease family protein n=1 Tax=Clostridium sp. TaxID=1506 RepID=UPI003F3A18EB
MNNFLLEIILTIPAILIAFTAQGYATALVADKLGDKTPRFQGKLTLNPIEHIDPVGFIAIMLFRFGWTKNVETNPSAFKRGYKDAIKVDIAAPLANLIVGFIFTLIYAIWFKIGHLLPGTVFEVLGTMMLYTAIINVNLFIFTLLPLPGLSGFKILKDLSPKTFYKIADTLYQYQMFILLGVVFFGGDIIGIPSRFIFNLFNNIAFMITGIFF